jgi:hypothetical protein
MALPANPATHTDEEEEMRQMLLLMLFLAAMLIALGVLT